MGSLVAGSPTEFYLIPIIIDPWQNDVVLLIIYTSEQIGEIRVVEKKLKP